MTGQEDKESERWTNFAGVVADRMFERFPGQFDRAKFVEWLTDISPELRSVGEALVDSRILPLLSIQDDVEDELADFIASLDVNLIELPEEHPLFSFEHNLAAARAIAKFIELSKGKGAKEVFAEEIHKLLVIHYKEKGEVPESLRFMLAGSDFEFTGPTSISGDLLEEIEASRLRRIGKLEEEGVHPRFAEVRADEQVEIFKTALLDTSEEDAAFDTLAEVCPNPQKLAELILATEDGKLPV